jgi:hypothetical protein
LPALFGFDDDLGHRRSKIKDKVKVKVKVKVKD